MWHVYLYTQFSSSNEVLIIIHCLVNVIIISALYQFSLWSHISRIAKVINTRLQTSSSMACGEKQRSTSHDEIGIPQLFDEEDSEFWSTNHHSLINVLTWQIRINDAWEEPCLDCLNHLTLGGFSGYPRYFLGLKADKTACHLDRLRSRLYAWELEDVVSANKWYIELQIVLRKKLFT